jgi:hypothetical protein
LIREFGPLGVGVMRVVAEYRSQAEECRKLGERVANSHDQQILEMIARAWEKFADLRQRDIDPLTSTPEACAA